MEILASCSRISTFGIRLPQSLSGFPNARLTVYCRCFYVFLHSSSQVVWDSLHHKDTNHIPNLQHQMRKFNVFNTKTCSRFPTKTSSINASKTISYITYHLLLTQNYENLKKDLFSQTSLWSNIKTN